MWSVILALFVTVPPPRVALSTEAAEVIAAAFVTKSTGLACLYGHWETYQDAPVAVIDSAVIAQACGAPALGMFGFLQEDADENAVLRAMSQVLLVRSDLFIAGEVHGVTRAFTGTRWIMAPLVWWAIRSPASHS